VQDLPSESPGCALVWQTGTMICFEVSLNGQRLTTAGIPGFAVLSTVITWVRSRQRPEPYRTSGVLDFSVGGLDSNPRKHADRKHLAWVGRHLAVGDVVEVGIRESESPDQPLSRESHSEAGSARRSNRYYLKEHLKRRREIDAVIVRLKRYVRKEEMEKAKRKAAESKIRRRSRG
jgi:hypothetical protein